MKATVAERGQVTIPKRLRDKLGIRAGATLEFSEERGRLIAVRSVTNDPVERVYGCIKLRKGTDDLMRELRGAA
jgi:AbrB family looped-hinge helix DNA binding protein